MLLRKHCLLLFVHGLIGNMKEKLWIPQSKSVCACTLKTFLCGFSVTLSWFQKKEVLISCVRIEDGQR